MGNTHQTLIHLVLEVEAGKGKQVENYIEKLIAEYLKEKYHTSWLSPPEIKQHVDIRFNDTVEKTNLVVICNASDLMILIECQSYDVGSSAGFGIERIEQMAKYKRSLTHCDFKEVGGVLPIACCLESLDIKASCVQKMIESDIQLVTFERGLFESTLKNGSLNSKEKTFFDELLFKND